MNMISGAWRFGVLSVLAFGVWAAPLRLNELTLYSLIALVFLIGSGLFLFPLFDGDKRISTCYKLFLPAFLSYAIIWCVFWFGIGGSAGELFGSAFGLAVFAFIFYRFYNPSRTMPFLMQWSVLFLFHTLGYTLGGMFSYAAYGKGSLAFLMEGHVMVGQLMWGLFYGLGFGAGLGKILER